MIVYYGLAETYVCMQKPPFVFRSKTSHMYFMKQNVFSELNDCIYALNSHLLRTY